METKQAMNFKGPGPRACGCRGFRSCLICSPAQESTSIPTSATASASDSKSCPLFSEEAGFQQKIPNQHDDGKNKIEKRFYEYCLHCGEALQVSDTLKRDCKESGHVNGVEETDSPGIDVQQKCHHRASLKMPFPGIHVIENFINEEEEEHLDKVISETVFASSQSGRRKQDFGPKVNFKKRKLKFANFSGLPSYSEILYSRMTSCPILSDFLPVEMCNLEYLEERGAHIEPHFDDFWLWGERLVTLNLLSNSVLTFTMDNQPDVVRVPMPRRSLIVVSGPARHSWKHSIDSKDIHGRRLAMTFRELSKEFQEAGQRQEEGRELVELALSFKGCAVGS